jgi:hypothetical protein
MMKVDQVVVVQEAIALLLAQAEVVLLLNHHLVSLLGLPTQ